MSRKENEKWLMFKNYMHNELGISKYDIQAWVKEAVQEQAKELLKNSQQAFDPDKILMDAGKSLLKGRYNTTHDLRESIALKLSNKIKMDVRATIKED